MTEAEWLTSSDARSMIEALWQASGVEGVWSDWNQGLLYIPESSRSGDAEFIAFQVKLQKFYLMCCRAIWDLLPQKESRDGVEVAERHLAGGVDAEEMNLAVYHAEGAVFFFDYDPDLELIDHWVAEIRSKLGVKIRQMAHPTDTSCQLDERDLLRRAAAFVVSAMISPYAFKGPPSEYFVPFLSADIVRTVFGNPFAGEQEYRPDPD